MRIFYREIPLPDWRAGREFHWEPAGTQDKHIYRSKAFEKAAPMDVLGGVPVFAGTTKSAGVTPRPSTRRHTDDEMRIAKSGLFHWVRITRTPWVSAGQGYG